MHHSILLIALALPVVIGSYCGQSAIPFTFQVLRSGYPVLGCARPKCFGWTANGTRAGESAQFYRVAGKDDGYLRRSDQFIKSPSKNANFVPQIAICADNYKSSSCEEGEWVGGIAPQSDPFADEVQMRCCSYQVLINSQDRGKATVKQGQLTVGGEVLDNGRLIAFDYISNVSKDVAANGTVTYRVTLKRMPCFEDGDVAALTQRTENNIVEAVANVQQPAIPLPAQTPVPVQTPAPVSAVPSTVQPIGQQAYSQNIQQYPQQVVQQQQQQQQQPQPIQGFNQNGAVQNNYGQFSQQGYGVAQNGQYSGYPQYVQQQGYIQQQQLPQGYPQQQQQPQPQYYQDPLTAMFQQQQQALQQQAIAQPQPVTFAPLPAFPAPMNLFPQAPVAAPAAASAASASAAQPVQQVKLPVTSTFPPMTLPKLEDLRSYKIPSVEDVEQVIPPVERAILTSVAKFFGVL